MTEPVTAPTLPDEVGVGGRHAAWAPAPPAYVVCDVDGTLVGPQDTATDEVVAAVARAQAAGIRVGFATGRMRGALGALADQLGALGPHVLHNGAEVIADGRTVTAWALTEPQIDALLDIAHGRDDLYVEIYPDNGYLASSLDERARPHWELLQRDPIGTLHRASDLAGATVRKATFVVFDPTITDDLVGLIAEAGLLPGPADSPRTPGLGFVNATHPDADKGRAVTRAAQHLGVPLAATVAIGDAANDLSMLAVAGTAIAMGQASAAVRDAAHLVVPTVDAHGVAVALEACIAWREAAGAA